MQSNLQKLTASRQFTVLIDTSGGENRKQWRAHLFWGHVRVCNRRKAFGVVHQISVVILLLRQVLICNLGWLGTEFAAPSSLGLLPVLAFQA